MVTTSDVLALVGNSGNVPKHLHLQADGGDLNAFHFVNHDAGTYTVKFFKDKGNTEAAIEMNKHPLISASQPPLLDLTKDFPLRVNAEINYGIQGNDFDEAKIFMDRHGTSPTNPKKDFSYGGGGGVRTVPKYGPKESVPIDQAIKDGGVYPLFFSDPLRHGVVDFLTDPITPSQVWPGDYDITVRSTSVLEQTQPDQKVTIRIAPLSGHWTGSGTSVFAADNEFIGVQVDAYVTQQGNSITALLAVTDSDSSQSYLETGQISSTDPSYSIMTFVSSSGETVSITNGSFSNGGLAMDGAATVDGSDTGNGTLTISPDGLTLTGHATTPDGRAISWTMTKVGST
jgi:hypothetical protein